MRTPFRQPSVFYLISLFIPIQLLILSGCITIHYGSVELQNADQLARAGKYTEAIDAYRAHMENRLAIKDRPEWENPYFYLLLIGDAQLNQRNPEAAVTSYQEAEQRGVTAALISDRYRAVARWYEQNGNLRAAFDLLQRFRDRDSLLFDAMLDRVARALTAEEDVARVPGAPPLPTPKPSSDKS